MTAKELGMAIIMGVMLWIVLLFWYNVLWGLFL